jgi:hypothetical protein
MYRTDYARFFISMQHSIIKNLLIYVVERKLIPAVDWKHVNEF